MLCSYARSQGPNPSIGVVLLEKRSKEREDVSFVFLKHCPSTSVGLWSKSSVNMSAESCVRAKIRSRICPRD